MLKALLEKRLEANRFKICTRTYFHLDESIEQGIYISKLIDKINKQMNIRKEIRMNNSLEILMEEAIKIIKKI